MNFVIAVVAQSIDYYDKNIELNLIDNDGFIDW